MRRVYAVPAVAALWTGLERTHGTFGFAWLDLGNAGINMSVRSVSPRLSACTASRSYSPCFPPASLASHCVIREEDSYRSLLWRALAAASYPGRNARLQRCTGVQPNIDPDLDWTSALREQTERQLTALSNALPAPLVIWPELPAPLYFYNDQQYVDE